MVLVAGANGLLGGTLVRRLRERGQAVRALSRNAKKLETLAALGAEPFAGDMLDRAAMDRACAGVTQIVSTANNILGRGSQNPNRIDEPMYRTLGAAARAGGVRRWVHVSSQHLTPDSVVDYFRVKHGWKTSSAGAACRGSSSGPAPSWMSGPASCSGIPSGPVPSRRSSAAATAWLTSSPWTTWRRSCWRCSTTRACRTRTSRSVGRARSTSSTSPHPFSGHGRS